MRLRNIVGSLVLSASLSSIGGVFINEFVTDPQQDRNGDNLTSDSDEYFELYNSGENEVSLDGWRLELNDISPSSKALKGTIPAKGFYLISNPTGAQNNDGELRLIDGNSNVVDSFVYGWWENATLPNGNSFGLFDESVSRYPDGSGNWVRTFATPESSNNLPRGELTLLIENKGENLKVSSRHTVSGNLYLQKSHDLKKWENVYTNLPEANLEFQEKSNGESVYYRAVEMNN